MSDSDPTTAPAGQLRAKAQRPIRFLIAGAINTALGLAIYPFLLWAFTGLRTHYLFALGIAQIIGVTFAYANYRIGVFQAKGKIGREFALFLSFYALIYVVNWIALPVLVEFGNIRPDVAQVGFNLIAMLAGYFWHSRVTFNQEA